MIMPKERLRRRPMSQPRMTSSFGASSRSCCNTTEVWINARVCGRCQLLDAMCIPEHAIHLSPRDVFNARRDLFLDLKCIRLRAPAHR